jgi:succinate dehydrogenase hydrophobic anchor subunit
MLRLARPIARTPPTAGKRLFSSNVLEADAGPLATRVYHAITTSLTVLTPAYFLVPDSYTDGAMSKVFGVTLTGIITAHSWIGLNYVATDYIPKVSKSLVGPFRYVNAGLAVITFLGMSKICISSPGGLKGVVKGVWNGSRKKKEGFEF